MKLIGAVGVMLVGAMIVGCAEGAPRAQAPSDITQTMQAADAELSSAIGTTTLTSAVQAKPAHDPNPRFLTTEPATAGAAPTRTWGAPPAAQDPTEASDLAQNPYTGTGTGTRDIYDPN
jgi:hypothetical protein